MSLENTFYCNTCDEHFKNDRCYKSHIKTQKHYKRETNQTNEKHKCACGKIYQFKQGLYVHRKTCKHKEHTEVLLIDSRYNELKRDMQIQQEQHERERDELRNQISLLLDKYADMDVVPSIETQQNHIETQQNIENQNNIENLTNIVVNINSFGNENIDYLDDDTVIDCIKQLHNSVPAIIEKVHFHPKHPENHNIQVTNKKLPYAKVMGKNQKWKTMNRSDAIDRMITNGYNILDDAYGEHKDKFSEFKQTVFEDFQKKYLDDDKQTHKKLRTSVDTLILNEGLS